MNVKLETALYLEKQILALLKEFIAGRRDWKTSNLLRWLLTDHQGKYQLKSQVPAYAWCFLKAKNTVGPRKSINFFLSYIVEGVGTFCYRICAFQTLCAKLNMLQFNVH